MTLFYFTLLFYLRGISENLFCFQDALVEIGDSLLGHVTAFSFTEPWKSKFTNTNFILEL